MANVDNGEIYSNEQMEKMLKGLSRAPSPFERIMEMKIVPTEEQMKREPPRVGRNEPCPCGSEERFRDCCLGRRPVNAIADGF